MERTKRNIVIGQRVAAVKVDRARELRRTPTPAEDLLWQRLRRNQLAGLHFRRQQPIDGFIVDFYCHRLGLVVELDGDVHADRVSYDTARDEILAARGLTVLRLKNAVVLADMPRALQMITERAARIASTLPIHRREGAGG